MTLQDNHQKNKYIVAQGLHWIIALSVIIMLLLEWMIAGRYNTPNVLTLIKIHKFFGILTLSVIFVRIIWQWLLTPIPFTKPLWAHKLVQLAYALLYIAIFLMILSQWVLSAFRGDVTYEVGVLRTFVRIKASAPEIVNLMRTVKYWHGWLITITLCLLVLHAYFALSYYADRLKRLLKK